MDDAQREFEPATILPSRAGLAIGVGLFVVGLLITMLTSITISSIWVCLTVWLAYGRSNLLVRVAACTAAMCGLFFWWVNPWRDSRFISELAIFVGGAFATSAIIAVLPRCFGWRLARLPGGFAPVGDADARNQFSLRELFVATGLIALCAGSVRLLLSISWSAEVAGMLQSLLISGAIHGVCAGVMAFAVMRRTFRWWILLAASVALTTAICIPSAGMKFEYWPAVFARCGGMLLLAAMALGVYRALGYRMVRRQGRAASV